MPQLFGLTPDKLLALSVLAALVSVVGNLVAILLKDILTARSFERWKSQQTLLSAYRRHQIPIFLAAEELSGRVHGLSRPDNDRPELPIGIAILKETSQREQHAMVSQHYYQYRFVSNAYRLCSFLGWVEQYRRDIGTLDVRALDKNRRLERCLANIQSVFADGWINKHANNGEWRDSLFFREEMRATGHRMIAAGEDLAVLDFGSFLEILQGDPLGQNQARWFLPAAQFFDSVKRAKDFRMVRMRMLVVYLTDLMEVLQPGRIPLDYLINALSTLDELDVITGGTAWRDRDWAEVVRKVRKRLIAAISVRRRQARFRAFIPHRWPQLTPPPRRSPENRAGRP